MDSIFVDGIEVKVVKKRIKNTYLRVYGKERIVLSAPLRMSDGEIEAFVFSKSDWLKRALEKSEGRGKNERKFVEGEEYCFLGKRAVMHTDTNRKSGYYFKGDEVVLCVGENSTPETRKKALAEFYRDAMAQILPEVAEECQRHSGLRADEWKIRDMTTRWGSCNTNKKRIWISLWLMEKPPECLTAVVYPELAHLKVKGHGKDFYRLLLSFCPDYWDRHGLLKRIK